MDVNFGQHFSTPISEEKTDSDAVKEPVVENKESTDWFPVVIHVLAG